jgi:serine/threonine protein kinase/DNA polymerase III delta prime subunit
MADGRDTVTDRVGQHFGNYELVQLLGQGGQASVYLGKHRYLNSYAALKVLNATIHAGNEQKFLAEAQTLADLRHPNIVHLLDFAIENGTPVLIMDYAPKGSLRQSSLPGTQFPLTTVVDFVTQIAAALQYAHNHGCIHRDVKPENILLDADDRLLLSDFGLSLLTPSSEPLSTQDPAGTARYMAPEQLRGKPGFASDQYALAVMVYEWLCGELPFHGNMWEIGHQHLHSDPPPLRSVRPEIPHLLEQVVLRALAKKPQDRFVSIQAFAQALARASQTSTAVEDHDSQVTDPLQAMTHASPLASPHDATTLSPHNDQIAQIPTIAQAKDPSKPPRALARPNQNRLRMLRRLRRSYSDLMDQSLQGAAWLDLGLASKPDAVQNAARLLLHVSNRAVQHLPSGTSLAEAYDEAEHELLILGEPGTGKSTLLLNLAKLLVGRAEQDQTHPLPVILPLSSWAVKRLPLQDWIAEQMSQIYDVPHKLSLQWVEEDSVLPLLDGLDEMEEAARSACVAAINTYHRDYLAPLVVCSRTTEYEAAVSRQRLALQGAVVVQPLTHEAVDAYLVKAGPPLAALRSALKKNTALHDLAKTPLMLNILILTYQGRSVHDLSNEESLLQKLVWDDYVQRMVTRRGASHRYPLGETQAWLSYLAQQMRDHNQTVFYLEHLQPDWLSAHQQRTYTRLAVRLPAIFIGVLMSILVSSFLFGQTKALFLLSSPLFGVLGGFLGSLWRGPVEDLRSQREHRHMWRKRLIKRLAIGVCFGLIDGFGFSFYLSSSAHYTSGQLQTYALSFGVIMGLATFLLLYLLTMPFHSSASSGKSGPRGWQRVVHFGSAVQGPRALLAAVVLGLSDTLALELTVGPIFGGGAGWSTGLSVGLIYALISLTLNTQMEDVRPTERLSWTWRSLRRGLFNTRHLRITVWLTGIGVICAGVNAGLSLGLSGVLNIGLSYWCLLGLFQGIAQERIDNQDRRIANQGIHRSLHNSVIMAIIGGGVIGSIGILSYWLILQLTSGLNNVVSHGPSSALISVLSYGHKFELISGPSSVLGYGLLLGICGALLIYMLTGGLAVLRHYTIRFLLWRSHAFPWKAPQFLDDACARFLLRRVGGGYSFAHRLLLDHLADTAFVPKDAASPSHSVHQREERLDAWNEPSAHARASGNGA